MGLFMDNTCTEIIIGLATITFFIVKYFQTTYTYWEKRGVATIKPRFLLGNANTILPQGFSVGTLSKVFYDKFKKQKQKFGGVYLVTTPNLVVVDPDYIKDILTKDFQHFVDRGFYYNKKDDPLSAHLFAIDGLDWKNLRVKLTPTFTSGKMKMMFDQILTCASYMKESIETSIEKEFDTKNAMSCFTTDVIGSCAFGIECNSFKHPDAEFRKMGKKNFEFRLFRSIRSFFLMNLPKLALFLRFKATIADVRFFFRKVVEETVQMREDNNVRRNDFLQLLIDMKTESNLSLDEISAQVFLFFIAGFDTSSTAMTFALYELARKPDLQKKLRSEIESVLSKHDNKISYESLNEMKYLGQVLDETLRMYPPLPTINRRCTKNYKLPNTDVTIEEGTYVLISTLGLHMDPEYYSNPNKFDPERFNEENKKNRHPFVYLPFGDGPRNCIGLRFGLMQAKIGIITMVKNFHLSVSEKTKPVELNPFVFLLSARDPVWLKAEKL